MTKLLPPGYASWTPARSCSPTSRASSCTSSMSPLPGSCAASAKAPTWARASPPRRSQSFSAWTAVRRHDHESGPRASARGEPCCDAESSSGCTGCPAAEVVDDAVDRIGDLPGPDLVDRMVGVREHDVPAAGNLGGQGGLPAGPHLALVGWHAGTASEKSRYSSWIMRAWLRFT